MHHTIHLSQTASPISTKYVISVTLLPNALGIDNMDLLHRFLFEELHIRGELVTLTDSYQQVLSTHTYPSITQQLLGQLMAASALLSSTLKLEGHLSLQAKGDGELSLLMAECTHQQDLRAIARSSTYPSATSLRHLLGKGHFCVTITPDAGQRYQGIVPLDGDTVASCLEHYFELSEQLPTRLIIASNEQRSSGLLLQVMPGHDVVDIDGWNRITQLALTLTENELLTLDHSTLITRLFHEELIRLYDPSPLRFSCSCSRQRTAQALVAVGETEAKDIIAEQGQIDMHCQFCHQHYRFDADDVAALFSGPNHSLH